MRSEVARSANTFACLVTMHILRCREKRGKAVVNVSTKSEERKGFFFYFCLVKKITMTFMLIKDPKLNIGDTRGSGKIEVLLKSWKSEL